MGNTNDKKNNFYLAGDIPGNEGNHDIKEKKSKKIEDKDNINNSKLANFVSQNKIQEYLSKNKTNSRDKIFNKLLEFEKKQLEKIINDKYKDFEKLIDREKENLTLIFVQKISESNTIFLKKIIINEIKCIKNDITKCKIDNINILLFGKTSHIKNILKKEIQEKYIDNNNIGNFITYKSEKYSDFKFFEYNKSDNNLENIIKHFKNENCKCLNCIWFCISSINIEESKRNSLQKLDHLIRNMEIPIILFFTNNEGKDELKERLKLNKIENNLVDFSLETFEEKELLNKVMQKCNKAPDDFKDFISSKIKREKVDDIIINFVNEYKYILSPNKFKNLINQILLLIYNDCKEDINLNIIDTIISKIDKYISEIINETKRKNAELLLDKQASLEKDNYNMRLENKRNLKGFEKSIEIFIQRNFHYIFQKIIIDEIIKAVFLKLFKERSVDAVFDPLLKKENRDKEINDYMEDCYLTKLEGFIKNNNLNTELMHPKLNLISLFDDEEESQREKEIDSFKLINSFDEFFDKNIKEEKNEENKENKWYPLNAENLKYLLEESLCSLRTFLEEKMQYQKSYFNEKNNCNDNIFKLLKKYELNNLQNFINSNKKNFILEINNFLKSEMIIFDEAQIPKIIDKEYKETYINKIKKEINRINKEEKEFCQIKYLSIIIIGKCGVGKSTLINGILKEQLAKSGIGNRVTTENKKYESKNMQFFKFIDTRGIELNEDYGPSVILENTKKIINEQKIESIKEMNDYIQCIWYCVNSNNIEEEEIKMIEKLKKSYESLPIIVVYTYALDRNSVEDVKNIIKKRFNGDIPVIPVLAKPLDGDPDNGIFGLEDLLKETAKINKKYIKGNICKTIKDLSQKKFIDNFKKRKDDIKRSNINNITKKFVDEYNKVLSDEEFQKYIIKLLEDIFISFLQSDENNEKIELNEKSKELLRNLTNIFDYIKKLNYKEAINKIVDPILDEKAIEFLDKQVEVEENKKLCIKYKNKCNKIEFKEKIKTFLEKNFRYIFQKYIICQFIMQVCEPISESIESQINGLLNKLDNNLFEEIYIKKCEDFEQRINNFLTTNNIYK